MDKTLSIRVKELCSERGLTLKQLAETMGIKPESLSRALGGNPQLSTLENIANALEVGVAELLTGGGAYEQLTSDFTAMVVEEGKTYLFHSKSELKDWINQ
ncbi:MAG: helix-turn-helix transcriptional regulator [Muribaculaceae bacterium]|nr:helix-turn-helix transcriptional regulator [Muribaculaceae bacterium]